MPRATYITLNVSAAIGAYRGLGAALAPALPLDIPLIRGELMALRSECLVERVWVIDTTEDESGGTIEGEWIGDHQLGGFYVDEDQML
jgi:hypothetical protein